MSNMYAYTYVAELHCTYYNDATSNTERKNTIANYLHLCGRNTSTLLSVLRSVNYAVIERKKEFRFSVQHGESVRSFLGHCRTKVTFYTPQPREIRGSANLYCQSNIVESSDRSRGSWLCIVEKYFSSCSASQGSVLWAFWIWKVCWKNKVFFLFFFFFYPGIASSPCVQTGSGAHPASYPMGTGGSFPGVKARPGRDADHSPRSSAEVKNE
jgi:hypothetical protein